MNQSKFSLADLLTVLGATGFGFFCFLSLNFLSCGKTGTSIGWAFAIAMLLGGVAFAVKLLKKTSRNFKTCIIWEWILLFLFVVFAFIAIIPFSHYFTVSELKDEIRKKVIVDIDHAEGMFTEYEKYAGNRENIYKSRLNSVVAGKKVNKSDYYNCGFVDGTPDKDQLGNKIFALHAHLFPTNYAGANGMKQVATAWLAKAKNTLESKWAFTFGIVEIVNNVQSNISEWENELKNFSSFKAQCETADNFNYPVVFNDAKSKITERGSPTIFSIFIALGMYVLMLLSYFISKRHTRYPGIKVIFGTSGVKENEL